MNESKSIIVDKSFAFAIRIIRLCQFLQTERREFILSKQLIRSGTAIGALVREAQNAQSSADFIHKLSISQKECDETIYWIELLNKTDYLNHIQSENILIDANDLLKMIRSAIITTKQKIGKS